jgi:hypothetical protein
MNLSGPFGSTRGNQSKAASILGVSRVTIWKRLKKFGIDPREIKGEFLADCAAFPIFDFGAFLYFFPSAAHGCDMAGYRMARGCHIYMNHQKRQNDKGQGRVNHGQDTQIEKSVDSPFFPAIIGIIKQTGGHLKWK